MPTNFSRSPYFVGVGVFLPPPPFSRNPPVGSIFPNTALRLPALRRTNHATGSLNPHEDRHRSLLPPAAAPPDLVPASHFFDSSPRSPATRGPLLVRQRVFFRPFSSSWVPLRRLKFLAPRTLALRCRPNPKWQITRSLMTSGVLGRRKFFPVAPPSSGIFPRLPFLFPTSLLIRSSPEIMWRGSPPPSISLHPE